MIQFDCAADWGNASADIRHKAVLSFSYSLPSFSGRNLLIQETAGGWQVNGIVTVQSGTPYNVSISSSTDWVNVGVPQAAASEQRPNWVHTPKQSCNKQSLLSEPYGTSTVSCVDITAYAAPTRFTYGNLHRYDLHGPGSWSNNLSLFKNFKIHEQTNFQLRVEAFNALNHANVGNPSNISFNETAAVFGCWQSWVSRREPGRIVRERMLSAIPPQAALAERCSLPARSTSNADTAPPEAAEPNWFSGFSAHGSYLRRRLRGSAYNFEETGLLKLRQKLAGIAGHGNGI